MRIKKKKQKKRSQIFNKIRLQKFLSFFERTLKENKASHGKWLVSEHRSYVDLSLFHLLEGLEFAFPNNYKKHIADKPLLQALRVSVSELPNIAAYLKSSRRVQFNALGIFRSYPELDVVSQS